MTRLPRLRHSGQIARLSIFNAAVFLVIGVQLPFWPVWLAGHGLDAQQIAAVFAAMIWAKVLATPAIGALADRIGHRRAVMAALAGIAFLGYAALWPVHGLWLLLILNLLAGVAQSALLPLGDAVTLAAVRERGLDYGRIRVWGSLSFIVASVGGGAVLAVMPAPDGGPDNRVLALVLVASLLLVGACLAIPSAPAGRYHAEGAARPAAARWEAIRRLLSNPRFWLLAASASALQSSHQLYYGFGTLYWRELGFSDTVIGLLWAEGVVAEIVLFWYGASIVARLGPLGLLALGGIGGIVRWSLMGLVPGLPAAAALQLLHALTFGASHLGAMYMLARSVPPAAAASAQSLYAALSAGLGSGLVMLAAGALYAAFGGQAYLFMALLSAAGLVGVWLLRRMSAQSGERQIEEAAPRRHSKKRAEF
ncbi:MAG: MFS transporter [Alphaproteobacteria bacterium]